MPLPQSSKTNSYNSGRSRFATLLILLVWVAALGALLANRQTIFDWFRLRNYQAPAAVAQLASQDTMTGYGRKVFYVNHPTLLDKTRFGQSCPDNGGEQTIVLGCYHAGQTGIFLRDVTDERLQGVEQVTAAHELLHAAYDRLNKSDKEWVNKALLDYYHNGLADQRIKDTIEAYKKTEPADLVNEMHSIFGTEVAGLPAPLEAYYKRYFTNRGQVAAFAAQYQSEFTSRRAKVEQYDARLAALRVQIESLQADLKAKQTAISERQSQLFAQRNSGNAAAYNAGVPAYNALVDAYNNEVEEVRSLIAEHNALVAERNAVALEENELVKALSSQPETINR